MYFHGDRGKHGQYAHVSYMMGFKRSVVHSHLYAYGAVNYEDPHFAINSGCLIDPHASAVDYAKGRSPRRKPWMHHRLQCTPGILYSPPHQRRWPLDWPFMKDPAQLAFNTVEKIMAEGTATHPPGSWIAESSEQHIPKASRHLCTHHLLRKGAYDLGSEDHLRNALTRL